jgi:hypothetical protein
MIHLELTDEQQEVLQEVLEVDLADLRMEIHETDDHDFKQGLRNKEKIMAKILAALQA